MEATLRIASEKAAYCLVDRATWLAHRRETDGLAVVSEGDERLFNPYSVIVVSPAKFSWLNTRLAWSFAAFIRSLPIPAAAKQRLLALTPASYIGLAPALAKRV